MRIIRDYQFVEETDRGACAAIGNFDGVHLGHLSVIELARDTAPDAPLGVMTFEPHPREFFAPKAPPFRLMSREARASRLEKVGVDHLYELNFNSALASLTPREFAQNVISDGLGLVRVIVGDDFCYGKGRSGNVSDLQGFGREMGFGVTVAPMLTQDTSRVSSTAIREALSDARPCDAAAMLGHWHRIEGPVISGEQRGRELGFPTANMSIEGLHPPAFGVYAVLVDVLDGPHQGSYQGAASLGVRPMFGENRANLETYLFDFSGDLYGAHVSIGLVDHLRPEQNFDTLEGLIAQMDQDCVRARSISGCFMKDPINRNGLTKRFWDHKPLSRMTQPEWEALCDGCGKCCLNKLEDEDTGEVALTCVACRLLDDETCRCAQYDIRHQFVPNCIVLKPENLDSHAYWMPKTCAYRLLWEGKPLFDWHPLISGTPQSVHDSGISVQHKTVSEFDTPEEDWEDHIIEEPT